MHPYRLGIVPAPQGKHSLRLQTGLVGKNRLPLWGHEIMRLGVDTGPVPTGCQELQPPARATAHIRRTWVSNLAVWTHLGIVQRKLVLRAFEDSFTEREEGRVKAPQVLGLTPSIRVASLPCQAPS